MTGAIYAVVALVVIQRLAELAVSRRNERRLRAAGGIEHGAGHYPFIVALHAGWLMALLVAVPASAEPDPWLLAAYAALQPLRYWTIASLKGRWTTRVIVLPGRPPEQDGPYRWVRHPNYLIVAAEIPLLPLAFGAVWLAAGFGLVNFALLAWRIQVESTALAAANTARSTNSASLDRRIPAE